MSIERAIISIRPVPLDRPPFKGLEIERMDGSISYVEDNAENREDYMEIANAQWEAINALMRIPGKDQQEKNDQIKEKIERRLQNGNTDLQG